jgi:hypothetical protein
LTDELAARRDISAQAIRKAMLTLQPILGDAGMNAMLRDLERHGLLSADPLKRYSISQIDYAFESIFGIQAKILLLRPVMLELVKETIEK